MGHRHVEEGLRGRSPQASLGDANRAWVAGGETSYDRPGDPIETGPAPAVRSTRERAGPLRLCTPRGLCYTET